MSRVLRWWESLPIAVQIVVAFVASMAFMLWFHLGPLRQPLGRGISYSIFWSVLGTCATVGATRAEAAKRRKRDARVPPEPPNPRRHQVR